MSAKSLVSVRTALFALPSVAFFWLAACGGDGGGVGSSPPGDAFNFPVGLSVSPGGRALYVANADFDLQYNAGTVMALDLVAIHAAAESAAAQPCALGRVPQGQTLGEQCAAPASLVPFLRGSVQVGAFAADVQVSNTGFVDARGNARRRLYVPVRGTTSLSWMDVGDDSAGGDPFQLDCGGARCDANHNAGNRADEPGNTRSITLPGEPTVLAQSSDGKMLVIGHVGDDKASLMATGIASGASPSLQFILPGLKASVGGLAMLPASASAPGQDLLATTRSGGTVNKLRYVPDEASALQRPYLALSRSYAVAGTASGNDSRGIVVDPSARDACVSVGGGARCAELPMPVFVANRSPASLLYGSLAPTRGGAGDELSFAGSLPLPVGPSRAYLAPIVDEQGLARNRLFVVSFDASTIVVIDPETLRTEGTIHTGRGPYTAAFDVFDPHGASEAAVRAGYRFAYVANFTQSFLQVVDLDRRSPTYLRVIYTLGTPHAPKGS